ncbi:sigma-70 family RNA polymerase sigma factor [Streptomyces sp. ISL-96]|nr:sigma-70 family RNA polymerase sigma factor [Streptomyces sp. ISL-96]
MDPSYLASRPGEEAAHLRWQHMWAHREQLLKVARRRSMSAEDAEDAVQEAMLRGAQHTHLDDARMGAWLTTVTMRLCVDRYRQVHREAQVSGTRTLTAPGPVPVEEAVCDRAEARWVAYQSKELPARQAEALRLKSEDRDIGQIAREMDLSYEAVESLLARARRTLRNSLAGTLALGLWLVGRGRDQAGQASQAGGHAQALAAASAAATLAVVGLIVPFAYEPAPPGPVRSGTSEAREDVDTAGYSENPAARSVSPASPDSSASPASSVRPDAAGSAARSGEASPTGLPTPLPVVPVPEVPVPEVPVPEVALPEVSPPLPAAPEAPRLPAAPPLPSAPPLPDTTAVPDAVGAVPTDAPTDVLDEAPHTGVRP